MNKSAFMDGYMNGFRKLGMNWDGKSSPDVDKGSGDNSPVDNDWMSEKNPVANPAPLPVNPSGIGAMKSPGIGNMTAGPNNGGPFAQPPMPASSAKTQMTSNTGPMAR